MNNVQIMSTSPQAGSAKAASSTKNVKAMKSTSKSAGFDDVLQKSQTPTDDKAAVQDNTTKATAQDSNDAAQAAKDAAADEKDARDVAAVAEVTGKADTKPAKQTSKNGKDAKETTATDDGKEAFEEFDDNAAANVASAILATKLSAVQTMLTGELKTLAKDALGTAKGPVANAVEDLAQALLDASSQKTETASDLMSLLPQTATTGKAQQAMLAMLSGQNTTAQDAQSALASLLQKDANPQQTLTQLQALMANVASKPEIATAMPNALQGNVLQTNAQQNAFASLQSLATPAVQQTVTQTAPLFASLQNAPAAQMKSDTASVNDFANLLGTNVTEETSGVDLGQQVLAAFQQQAGANADANQQGAQQQAMTELLMTQDGEQAVTQLPEEAAFDKAPTTQEAVPSQSAGITSFAQTLQNLDGTQQASSTQAAQQPQADYDIPQQIVDQARLIQRGQDTEMVIHLKPEHLGDLTLRVSVGVDGAVNASFHSNNAEVRTIIENTLVQLKQDLNDQGIKVDNVGVYAGLADGGLPQQDGGQQQGFQQGSQRHHSTQESAEAFEDGQELATALAAQKENAATDGVDYRV